MPQAIIKKLFDSLNELESSVKLAKKMFCRDSSEKADQLLARIEYYEEVLGKQKRLASSLCDYIRTENWAEVNRHVKLINGLSALVSDDARGLIQEVLGKQAAQSLEEALPV